MSLLVEDEDEQWAANPWQAQADAHLLQLTQGPCYAAAAVPSIHCDGQAVLCSLAAWQTSNRPLQPVASPPFVPQRKFLGQGPLPQLGLGSAHRPGSGVQRERALSEISTVDGALSAYIGDLEGQVAQLEETAARRERDLQESTSANQRENPGGSPGLTVEVQALKEQNDFLSNIISRFETKTMHLQGQMPTRSVVKLEHQFSPRARSSGSLVQDVAAQTEIRSVDALDGRLRQLVELEGQVALLEDAIVGKDQELVDIRTSAATPAEDCRAALSHEVDCLSGRLHAVEQERDFFQGLVARYERKVMDMEAGEFARVTADLARAEGELAEKSTDLEKFKTSASELNVEVAALRTELVEQQGSLTRAEFRVAELSQLHDASNAKAHEHQEQAQRVAVTLKEVRQQHNQKTQDLLRRLQTSEQRTAKAEDERRKWEENDFEKAQVLEAEAAAEVEPKADPNVEAMQQMDKELQRLRKLNSDLLKKLQDERLEHVASRESLSKAVRDHAVLADERHTTEVRLRSLAEQLYTLVEENEALSSSASATTSPQAAIRSSSPHGFLGSMS